MPVIDQSEAIDRSEQVRDETVANANTATRVGQLLADIAESVTTWPGIQGPPGDDGAPGADGAPGGAIAGIVTETTTARTLVLGDAQKVVRCTNAAAVTVTVPANATVAYPLGTTIYVRQVGVGQVTLVGAGGVTLNTPDTLKTRKQHATITLTKVATDEWDVSGALLPTQIDCYSTPIVNAVSVNGVRVTLGVLGTALADANATLSVAGGYVYQQLAVFTANHTITLNEAGAVDNEGIEISRHVTDAYTLTVNNSLGEELYKFPAGVKRLCVFVKDPGVSGKFKRGMTMAIS